MKLLLAPAFVVLASLCARRFGPRIGGLIGGLPVVAGPILLVLVLSHGRHFGATSAQSSLLGLVSLSAFVGAYATICRRTGWRVTATVAWLAFLAATAVLSLVSVTAGAGLALAAGSFVVGLALVPRPAAVATATELPAWDLPMRAVTAAAMVVAITAVSGALGPHVSGLLAPAPIVTSVLAAFTQAQRGPQETLALLRGMLVGFFAFAAFSFTVAVSLPAWSTGAAFALATTVAVAVQLAWLVVRRGGQDIGATRALPTARPN